jgi:hypothetical protein
VVVRGPWTTSIVGPDQPRQGACYLRGVSACAVGRPGTELDPAAVLMGVYRPDPGMEFTFPIIAWPPSFTCTCT